MLSFTQKLIETATQRLLESKNIKAIIIVSKHFNIRVFERVLDSDFFKIERTLEKAFMAALPGEKIEYIHPTFRIKLIGRKRGVNGFELISCWKEGE